MTVAVQRKIIHLDMDAFYASVEILDNPDWYGKPVIVGGEDNRGVVCAASYAARKYGVHSAQPVAVARKLCPDGVFLRPRMARYRQISRQIMAIFKRFTPLVEPLSLDEAFLDVTASERLFGPVSRIAENIREIVKEETGLTVSAGVAASKLVAKIASDLNKPDGLTVVEPGRERQFLSPLPIRKLWGVGHSTREALEMLGVQSIGDLARLPLKTLAMKFGKHGTHLHNASRAEDNRAVEPGRSIKSIGHEETFSQDLVVLPAIKKELLQLSVKVAQRLRLQGFMARTVVIKTKYYDFTQTTRSRTIQEPTDDNKVLYRVGCSLLFETLAGRKPLRLLGITTGSLVSNNQPRPLMLFRDEEGQQNRKKLNEAVDKITDIYGGDGIKPGTLWPAFRGKK